MTPPEDNLRAELGERIRFESLLADLSARFVGLPAEALDREIVEAQRRICETLGLDGSTLGQPSRAGEPQFTHTWGAPGTTPIPLCPAEPLVPWATRQILSGHTVQFMSFDELPLEAATDKETFRRLGVKSALALPLIVGCKPMGMLSFGTAMAERQWPESLVHRLRLRCTRQTRNPTSSSSLATTSGRPTSAPSPRG